MENKGVVVVCTIVGVLGLAAAAMGFAAEAKRIKASQVEISYDGCVFPRSTALALGLGAAFALLVSQIIIIFTTVCLNRSNYSKLAVNRSLVKLFYILSRIAFGFGFMLLLAGALINTRNGGEKTYGGGYYVECYVVKPGVFAGGAVLCLASVAFGIVSYLTLSSAKMAATPNTNYVDPSTATSSSNVNIGSTANYVAQMHPHAPPQNHQYGIVYATV